MKPTIGSPSYLVRNPYSYCFRMKVPKDLQGIVGKKEIRYSLHTGYVSIARNKARFLACQVHLIFRFLRKGGTAVSKLSDDQIKALVEKHIKNTLEWLDRSFYEEWDDNYPAPFTDAQEFHSYVDSLEDIRNELISNLNLGDFSMLENTLADIIKTNGIDDVDKQSTLYRKLCAEIHKAEIKLIPIQKRHMMCDFSYKNELPDVFPEIFPTTSEGSPVTDEQESETLERIFEAFWKEKEPEWKNRTVTEYTTCRNHLLSFLGSDTQIHAVDYQKGREYKNALMEKRNKKGKTLSKRRINMYLSFASQLFNYAEKNHYIDRNPFKGLQI